MRAIRLALGLLACAACVPIADEYRCDPAHDCVLDGVVGRCESTGHCSLPDPTCGTFGFRYHTSAGQQAGICVLGPAPVIETQFDLKASSDQVQSSCAPEGARDRSIELFVLGQQTITIDTVGVEPRAAVVLSLRDGACPAGLAEIAGCRPPICGGSYNALALTLGPGAYCLVVEEAEPTATAGQVALRIVEAGREAVVIDRPMPSPPQTTCGAAPDPEAARCVAPSNDPAGAAVFVACPGTRVRATVTPDAADGLDLALSLRDVGPLGNQLACKNDATGAGPESIDTVVTGPTWLVVHRVGGGPACGGFSISHQLGL